jgi:hypothetical protein
MAYGNFIQQFWSEHIQRELEKLCVLQSDCDYTYEGEVKSGGRVKILGVGRPAIGSYTGADIGAPEKAADTSVYLDITQSKYFNFMVDDVEKAQSTPGLMEKLTEEAAAGLAQARDTFIAELADEAGGASASLALTGADGALSAIDAAFEYLWGNGVRLGADVTITLTPWFYNLFKSKLTEVYSNNIDLIKKGIIGMYNGSVVKISNNLYNDGTDDCMMVRTKRAVAFAGQIERTEAYRPHGLFGDALKGLDVYGAKVVRPKELYVIKAHAGEEA